MEIGEKVVGYEMNEVKVEEELGVKVICVVEGKEVKKLVGICVFEKEVGNRLGEDYGVEKGEGVVW